MSKDVPRLGAPSSWSSDEPATGPPVVHSHPLPTSVRVILVIYGLMLATVLGGLFWLVIAGQTQDERGRDAIVKKVEANLKAAQEKGAARDKANAEKIRAVVCKVIGEFKQTPNVLALSRQLGCGIVPSPTPAPPSASRTEASAAAQPQPDPAPRPSPPHPSRTARPRPTPTQTCLLPAPLPCTGLQGL